MFDIILHWATDAASTPSALWVAGGLMALESMIAPVPSEFVMPPLGAALHEGTAHFTALLAIAATSAGSLIGSLISYAMGYFGGKPLVMKVGRYLLVNEHHLDLTSHWFGRWGGITVFICRFVPVVGHLISIPAGIARMNLLKFCIYTLIGATLWNSLLFWAGWKLEENMKNLLKYRTPIDLSVVVLGIIAIIAWYWLNLRNAKRAGAFAVQPASPLKNDR